LNVEPRNAQELAQAVIEITEDKQTYEAYCKGARQRYEQLFTFDKMIDNSLEIYENVMK
jgi:rhamnosyl/mannosyltransferase